MIKRSEGILFLLIFISVFIVWNIFFQVPLTSLYGINDTFGLIAHYAEMLRLGSTASDFIYSSTRLGGSVVGPVDMPVMLQFLSLFKLQPILAINLTIITTQAMLAFIGLQLCLILTEKKWFEEPLSLVITLVLAFNPALAWRVFYGHLNIAWAVLWGLSLVYLFVSLHHRRLTVTGIIVSSFVFINSLQCINLFQPLIYTILILVVTLIVFRNSFMAIIRDRSVVFYGLLILTSAFLFSLVNLANILQHVPELPRDPSQDLIYSYNVESFWDYIGSLFYSTNTIETGRNFFLLHETNLAFGVLPIFLVIICYLAKSFRLFWLNLCLFMFAVILSSDLPILSPTVLTLLPFLKSFRCPSRFFVPLIYFELLSLSFLILKMNLRFDKQQLILAASGLTICILAGQLMPSLSDYLFLPVFILCGFLVYKKYSHSWYLLAVLFCTMNLLGFVDKLPSERLEQDQYELEKIAFQKLSLPTNLLEHASSTVYSSTLKLNQSATFGYSSSDGYVYPTKRFQEFMSHYLQGVTPATYAFSTPSGSPAFEHLSKLLNITHEIRTGNQGLRAEKIKESMPVFSPESIRLTESFTDYSTDTELNKATFIAPSYSHLVSEVQKCTVSNLVLFTKQIDLKVNATVPCLIVLSTQYSNFFQAFDDQGNKQTVVPANWLMTGVIVQPMNGLLSIKILPALQGEIYFKLIGIALILCGMWLYHRKILIKV